MSDDLGSAASTALKARFPEPDEVELLGTLRIEPAHPRRRTLLAVAACVTAVVVVAVVAVALSTGGSPNQVASAPSPGNSNLGPPTKPPACRPGAADVTVRLGGPQLLGNRVPVKVRATLGDDVRVVVRFGSRDLTRPTTQSPALHAICSTGGQTVSTYFRTVHAGSATVTSSTSDCNACMQVDFVAHIGVAANKTSCCTPASQNAPLLKLGLGSARAQGAVAQTITAVRSHEASAVRLLTGDGVSGNQPVWAIQVKAVHSFTCRTCTGPAGTRVHGRYLLLIVGASSLEQLDFGVNDHPYPLAELGHVITIYSR